MINKIFGALGVFLLFTVTIANPVIASELIDVKPIVTGSDVIIEVSADIPMTFTYYKVPGQARAVVDIADADPEKVEPLIVVNKGAVASISVDKVMISDMTVSRLVFNLVSESQIAVKQSTDRKTLIVSFGAGKTSAAQPALPEPVVVPVTPKESVTPVAAAVIAPDKNEPAAVAAVSKEEEDPLGLEEPPAASTTVKSPEPTDVHSTKLEPVVPGTILPSPSAVVVKGVVIGASFIDIQTNGPVASFRQLKLSKPERLTVEIPGSRAMTVTSIKVGKFGVSKVRIGTTPGFVRVVLDTAKTSFPKHDIVSLEKGLRINFR